MAIIDYQAGFTPGADGPYTHGAAVTPDNSNDLPFRTLALYVGGAGNLSFITSSGETVSLTAVPAGTLLRVRADRVRTTGTSATLIVALA